MPTMHRCRPHAGNVSPVVAKTAARIRRQQDYDAKLGRLRLESHLSMFAVIGSPTCGDSNHHVRHESYRHLI